MSKRTPVVTIIPSTAVRVNLRYVRESETKKVLYVTWPSAQRRKPKPKTLTRREWATFNRLAMKLCESAYVKT